LTVALVLPVKMLLGAKRTNISLHGV